MQGTAEFPPDTSSPAYKPALSGSESTLANTVPTAEDYYRPTTTALILEQTEVLQSPAGPIGGLVPQTVQTGHSWSLLGSTWAWRAEQFPFSLGNPATPGIDGTWDFHGC